MLVKVGQKKVRRFLTLGRVGGGCKNYELLNYAVERVDVVWFRRFVMVPIWFIQMI